MLPKTAICFVFVLIASACGVGEIVGGSQRGILDENRQKWIAAGITSYTYREDRSCFCGFFGPADVSVVDGQIVAVRQFVPDTIDVDPANFHVFDTIDGLFDVVAEALDQDAHELLVTYDPQLGFPTRISIDYIEHAIDDEIVLTASALAAAAN